MLNLTCPFCKITTTFGHVMYQSIWMVKLYCSNCYVTGEAASTRTEAIINFWKACEKKERAGDLRRQVETFNFLLDQMEKKIKYQTTQVQLEYKRAIVSLLSKEYESEEEKMNVIFSKILVFAALKGIRL